MCPFYIVLAVNLQNSHEGGERLDKLIRPTQMSSNEPQRVWLQHSSVAPVFEPCQTQITALCRT